jgi:two-component SAPR family response regulator
MNQGAFLMRGLETIRAESSLTALVYNLRRVLDILRLPKLIDLGVAKADCRAPV